MRKKNACPAISTPSHSYRRLNETSRISMCVNRRKKTKTNIYTWEWEWAWAYTNVSMFNKSKTFHLHLYRPINMNVQTRHRRRRRKQHDIAKWRRCFLLILFFVSAKRFDSQLKRTSIVSMLPYCPYCLLEYVISPKSARKRLQCRGKVTSHYTGVKQVLIRKFLTPLAQEPGKVDINFGFLALFLNQLEKQLQF